MKRPVRLSALAALDLQQARAWFDAREPGLGDTFLDRVNETIARIAQNPEQYQITIATYIAPGAEASLVRVLPHPAG